MDLETVNIDAKKTDQQYTVENCVICEIGIIKLDLDSGVTTPIFNNTCKEDINPDPESWIFKNTPITCEMVKQSPHFDDFKDGLQELFNKNPATSWGHDFDFDHLKSPLRSITIPTKFWDPKLVLTDLLKIPNPWREGYKWPRVAEAFKYFHPTSQWKQAHRAIDDAEIEADIIFRTVKKWPFLKDQWADFV